jgi:hypothetical protein
MNLKTLAIVFVIGIVIGGGAGMFSYSHFHKCPEVKTGTNTITKIIRDTLIVYKELAGGIPAKTGQIHTNQTEPSRIPCAGKDSVVKPTDDLAIETYKYADTTLTNGTGVHVEYWFREDMFKYKFKYPERTIAVTTDTRAETNNTRIIKEVPVWELGIGGSCRMFDSKLNYSLFPVLEYNTKLLFLYLTLEGKGDITLRDGKASLDPSLEAKLKIGL